MSIPSEYAAAVNVPLPDEDDVKVNFAAVIGSTYDPDATLNVVKIFAGTEGMFEGVIGLVQRIFGPEGIDNAKNRQMIILRVAKDLDAPYEWQVNADMAKKRRAQRRGDRRRCLGRSRHLHRPRVRVSLQGRRRAHSLQEPERRDAYRTPRHLRRGPDPQVRLVDRLL